MVVVDRTSGLGGGELGSGPVNILARRMRRDWLLESGAELPEDELIITDVKPLQVTVVPAALATTDPPAAVDVNEISVIGALVLLAVYFSWVIPFAREGEKHGHLEAGAPATSPPASSRSPRRPAWSTARSPTDGASPPTWT